MAASSPGGFRPDIQGLRGIAVLLVVLFHADVALTGGFVGVDVFFVISGFVITQMLLRELDATGAVNLRDFYARRVRRLLPALALVSIATLAAAIVVMSPTGPQQLAASTSIAASAFLANVHFVASAGYFDPAERTNPFLHTWSLAVEEQFYLLLPVTLLLLWRLSCSWGRSVQRQLLIVSIGLGAALSLWASWACTFGHVTVPFVKEAQRFAFYGPVTRIWEFAVGVLLAVGAARVSTIHRHIATVLGVAGTTAILWSAVTYNATTPFPGVAAVVPVTGAGLLLIAGGASAFFARMLSWRPVAWIGDRSYGWYLWSWPATVLTRVVCPSNHAAVMIAAAGALAPAGLSYRFLEQPIRRNREISGWRAMRLAAICVVVPIAVAAAVTAGAGLGWGLVIPKDVALLPVATQVGCDSVVAWPADRCTFRVAHARGSILLLGDSHAQVIADAVTRAANAGGFDLAVWTRSGCPYLGRPVQRDWCAEWQAAATALAVKMRPDLIVIANYSTERSTYVGPGSMLDEKGQPVTTPADALAAWRDGLEAAVQHLAATGATVVLVHTVPEFETPGYRDISWLRPHGTHNTISWQQLEERRRATVNFEQALAAKFGFVELFDPAKYLCGAVCSTFRNGTWLYFDYSHLSLAGAAVLDEPLTALFNRRLRATSSGQS